MLTIREYVTPSLREIFEKATPRQQEEIISALNWYRQGDRKIDQSGHQREGIAAGLHDEIEALLVELRKRDPENAQKVSCKRGCAYCCYIEVGITSDEALLLRYAMQEIGLSIDLDRLRLQASHVEKGWSSLAYEQRRCVFLQDDNSCGVYEYRPMACRKHNVITAPEKCDTNKYPGGEIGKFVSVEAEIAHNAAIATFKSGSMSQMLLETIPTTEDRS